MRFYDLFAGIGGFRLGLERAGHECVGSCEIEKNARKIYGKNFGAEPEYNDAFKLDAGALPDFHLLAAGFPCQAFSLAGKRLGFADTRGTLFFEIARIAKQKRPRILLLENVEGLLFHEEGRTFGTILNTLDELGYDVEWQVLNGRYFLPQNRERVFIVGHLRGEPIKQVFPLGEMVGRDEKATEIYSDSERQAYRCYGTNGIMSTLQCIRDFNGKIKTKQGIRMLTPLECERLQGFPDGWTEGIPEQARYRCLGNAVMPPVVEYIARHL